jgi:hypothetical protein
LPALKEQNKVEEKLPARKEVVESSKPDTNLLKDSNKGKDKNSAVYAAPPTDNWGLDDDEDEEDEASPIVVKGKNKNVQEDDFGDLLDFDLPSGKP